MSEIAIRIRNKITHGLYKYLLKPVFFRNDPEAVHDWATRMGIFLGEHASGQKMTGSLFGYENSVLEQEIAGIRFKNPVGLSAGFDKDGKLTGILPFIGFGFAEIGSVTGRACAGNPKPRLWRLPRSKSLVVYYGLKNEGCEKVAKRLKGKRFLIPIGISVAMTNCKENLDIEKAVRDYAFAFRALEDAGSYITVNISCPNTLGGQPFMQTGNLDYLLDVLDDIPTKKPVFLKIAPDLAEREVDEMLSVAKAHRVHGIICTNLTKMRDNPRIREKDIPEKGGLSGKVVEELADKMLAYIYKKEGQRFVLVGSGGIFTAEDAYRKIRLGASLVQIITGMVYEGPQVISEINQGLAQLLRKDGFTNISQAIGIDNI